VDRNAISGARVAEALFCRPEGATMDEVIAATGGPQYNVLRRLGAKGYTVRKVREGRGTRYFVVPPADPSYELTISERGQVVLPKDLREKLRIEAGGKLTAEIHDGKIVLAAKSSDIMDVVGILHRPGMRPRTQEEIDDAIKAGAVARAMRGLRRAGQ
jgi:AbrB family looped-hinge helix DNA binding protein